MFYGEDIYTTQKSKKLIRISFWYGLGKEKLSKIINKVFYSMGNYRIKLLERFCDQYKNILDVSIGDDFYSQCLSKGYNITRLSADNKIIKDGHQFVSIYQGSSELLVKYDLEKILLQLLSDNYSKEIVIKINSTENTCFGLTAEKIEKMVSCVDKIKFIDFNKNHKQKKFNSECKLNLIIIKKDIYKPDILNARVGDFIEVPIERINIGWFHALNKDCIHPYYLAAKAYLETTDENKIFNIFEGFRDSYKINNPAELLGLEGNNELNKPCNIFDFVFPWTLAEQEDFKDMMLNAIRNENLRYGLDSFEVFGNKKCTSEKSRVETKRICELADSILKNGYQENSPEPISACLLVKDEDYQFFIKGGNHRAAILHALGKASINLKVYEIVKFSDIFLWKNTVNKKYTNQEAKGLFSNIFYSIIPSKFPNLNLRGFSNE